MEQRSDKLSGNGNRAPKLLTRDISESLGKLPPQVPEMEEAVLGALMLETDAFDKVAHFLKAPHFYSEAHKLIYEAILALKSAGTPVDMRTVIHQLRTVGKLELIGGAYKVAELTSKVSSAANIETHARIIVEQGVKRSLITYASQIHHDAYEDTTDVFELLDKLKLELEFIDATTTKQTIENLIKEQWLVRFLTTAPPKTVPLITIDGCPVVTIGNYTQLIGKKKSRKTLFMIWLIAEYLKHNPTHFNRIIMFDTEQGVEEVWEIREKIWKLTGKWIHVAHMRGMSPPERRDFIKYTIQYWPDPKPVLVTIDGIRDLMSNINDPDEATDLMVWLDRLTMEHRLGVINVLHMNKTDTQARGHIGTELGNKSFCTVELELDAKTGLTVVRCESARKKPFDPFAFTHAGDGLPALADMPVQGNVIPPSDRTKRIMAAFADGAMKYNDAWTAIGIQFDCGTSKAKKILATLCREGLVAKSGKDRDKNTSYKLMSADTPDAASSSSTGLLHTPRIDSPPPPETELFSEENTDRNSPGNFDANDLPF